MNCPPAQELEVMCNCNNEINTELAKHNGKLAEALVFGVGRISSSLLIGTMKINAKDRRRVPHVFPSYCPFCGEKYPSKDAAQKQEQE